MEVVNLSKAKYPNRDALREANDIYLDAMYLFVTKCLDKVQDRTAEELIRNALGLSSHNDIEGTIEISDIAHLVRTYWSNSFEQQFEAVDRYYEARSAVGLIVEGRNRASHRPWDLDPEFTRTQLFLIAELLGKINKPDEQREVEAIRDKLFDDTTEQLVTTAVEIEKAKYEKTIAEVEKHLSNTESSNKKLSKQITDNAVKLDKKTEELEKLSGQLIAAKLDKKESEKRFNSSSKQLEKVRAEHSACEERLTTLSDQLASIEVERDDYKKHLETASTELESVKVERSIFEERLTATSNELVLVQAKKDASERYLAVTRNLLTTVGISDQSVFPPLKTDSVVRILDRRGMNKRDYLLELLEQKQPTIIYVQSEEMVETLLDHIVPEKADFIEKHGEQTSEAEEMEILEKLNGGELIAVVSDATFSTLKLSHCVEHFVLCHLVPGVDEFYKRCEPVFASAKSAYLHLIYNDEQDAKNLDEWLTQKYPDRETLNNLYRALRECVGINGDFIKTQKVYNELDIAELGITELGIETGLAIFEEVGALERNNDGIKLLLSPEGDRKFIIGVKN